MFKQQPVSHGPANELTTAARIRDAAIELFGDRGFAVGVRAIAAAAGVSPGLVNHHFGSKDGLRSACDERVLQLIHDEKLKSLLAPDTGAGMLSALAEVEAYGPLLAYMIRSLEAGGPMAESLLEHMISDAEDYIRQGVEAGVLKPSRDPRARARYLVLTSTGATLLWVRLHQRAGEPIDFRAAIRRISDELTPPAVELYTQGMLTDPTLLDRVLEEH
ncbi:TetR/AcrR family transcriptional regulator [Nocardia higoensis]|uniref:TetR/AcrR family transcriptional regulator n=1 Tax=Nocardia higoensis TaxID=228599 RepID=UPI0003136FA8|nr:TetR family transcriptional regulator [Nocardia higoensis]